jgi:hypothetical protein
VKRSAQFLRQKLQPSESPLELEKLNIENVKKKLREAKFFLNKMDNQGQKLSSREQFDFYLSAFLSAARTVDYRLEHEQDAVYRAWRKSWDASLSSAEALLIKLMVDDRNVEVHESGSGRRVRSESVSVPAVAPDQAGLMQAIGVAMYAVSDSPTVMYKPSYYFTIEGIERKAVDVCGEYLKLMERMVTQFKAVHP